MAGQVEFFYDLVSPYSYLAHDRLRGVCERRDAELVFRPMLLGALQRAVGLQAPVEVVPKSRYIYRDIERWAAYYGVPLEFPDPFPFRTLATMRAALFCEGRGKLGAFTREAFDLYWAEGGAPKGMAGSDEQGPLSEVARRIGEDPEEVSEGASETEVKEALKGATTEAQERGAFGAPTFFVGDEMFWGNDRLHFVEEALGRD